VPGIIGALITRPTAASDDEPPTRAASEITATMPIQSPRDDTTCASHRRRNDGDPSRARRGRDPVPPSDAVTTISQGIGRPPPPTRNFYFFFLAAFRAFVALRAFLAGPCSRRVCSSSAARSIVIVS